MIYAQSLLLFDYSGTAVKNSVNNFWKSLEFFFNYLKANRKILISLAIPESFEYK